MSDISMIITVTREQQIAIEEYCVNAGLTISQYLVGLHNAFQYKVVPAPETSFSKFMEDTKKMQDDMKREEENSFRPMPDAKLEEVPRKKKSGK